VATVSERIKKIIANQLGVAETDIKPDSRFNEDLNADSLDMVELTMAMEEEFSTPENAVSIPDEDAESFKTVQDTIDYIRNLGSGNKQVKTTGEAPDNSGSGNIKSAKKRSFISKFIKNKRARQ
jgi:acyl carrier protein